MIESKLIKNGDNSGEEDRVLRLKHSLRLSVHTNKPSLLVDTKRLSTSAAL